jgi:hypothetical protein
MRTRFAGLQSRIEYRKADSVISQRLFREQVRRIYFYLILYLPNCLRPGGSHREYESLPNREGNSNMLNISTFRWNNG